MKNNPYIGPRPFERSDRDRFFGRARETRDLLSLIMAERVVLFYAQSGAGKTSLLNTQIVPALEEEGFKVLPIARVGSDAPRGVEAASVKNVFIFSALLALAGPQGEISLLYPQTLKGFLTSIVDDDHPPIIIFDQFEELLTTHRDHWEDARGFFEQLRAALQAIPKLGVVLAMREDHVAGLDPYANLLPKRLRTRFRMELLGYDGALEAVKKPAQNAGCAYGTGVAEQLADDLRRIQVTANSTGSSNGALGPYVEPVQLQVVCSRLWDNLPEREEHIITWPEIEQFGNIDRALTDFYESALQHTAQETSVIERQLRRWFATELITPMKTRGLALRGEHDTNGLPNAAVDVLDRQHLIRAESRAGAYWYELAHDRLVEPIVNSNAAYEQARLTSLRITAQKWQQNKTADLLYGGSVLEDAIRFTKTHPDDIEDYEHEFLDASVHAQRTKARNRIVRLTVIAALSVGMIIMAALAVLAWQSKQEADQQRAIAYEAKATAETGKQEAEQQKQIAVTAQAQAEAGQLEAEQQKQIAVTAQAQAVLQQQAAGMARATAVAGQAEADQQARIAIARELAAAATANLETDRELSLLLALEAISATYQFDGSVTTEAEAALDAGLNISPSILMMGEPLTDRWGFTNDFNSGAYNPDGSRIATGMENGTVVIWDGKSGQRLNTLSADGAVRTAIFSPDGQHIAASTTGGWVYLWNANTYQPEARFEAHGDYVVSIAYRSDGARIATSSWDNTARIWDEHTHELLRTLSGHAGVVETVSYSSDGTQIVTAGRDGTARVWNAETGEQRLTLPHAGTTVSGAVFSPDGRQIVTAAWDGILRMWDAQTGKQIQSWQGHTQNALSVQYSPDGKQLVTAGGEGVATIWNALTGQPLRTLQGHVQDVRQAVFSPDGGQVLTVSYDGTARVWPMSIEEWLKLARDTAGQRVLSCKERQKYLHQIVFCPTPFP